MTFRDHFSASSPDYAKFRPRYPETLFRWIAEQCPARERVWDCGTGTGQAAVALAGIFRFVVATDASRAQLDAAERHARVAYARCAAEAAALRTSSVDAVTVAQAVHWFDMPAFFREAARVARPGALVARWTYGNLQLPPEVEALFVPFYEGVVGPYWPPERRIIERAYEDVPLPFAPVAAPAMTIEMPITLEMLAGYIRTWSATQRYREALNHDPVPEFIARVAEVWGDPSSSKHGVWPLWIRAGRV
jgi:ubiquinone/menaquinone biosynthesis C-methylase UbiE